MALGYLISESVASAGGQSSPWDIHVYFSGQFFFSTLFLPRWMRGLNSALLLEENSCSSLIQTSQKASVPSQPCLGGMDCGIPVEDLARLCAAVGVASLPGDTWHEFFLCCEYHTHLFLFSIFSSTFPCLLTFLLLFLKNKKKEWLQ